MHQVGDLGFASELGNYAEYSGAPNEEEVLQYARVVIDVSTIYLVMHPSIIYLFPSFLTINTQNFASFWLQCATAEPDGRKRALVIGGGIANFTDVAATFNGIIRALKEKVRKLAKYICVCMYSFFKTHKGKGKKTWHSPTYNANDTNNNRNQSLKLQE